MAYFRNDLISRPGYSGIGAYSDHIGNVGTRGALTYWGAGKNQVGGRLGGPVAPFGGFIDTVGEIGKGALSFFGAQQRAAGGQEALQQALAAQQQQQQQAQSGGISTTTLLVGAGVVGLAAILLLRKKKSP
jgi:hypothetical protein